MNNSNLLGPIIGVCKEAIQPFAEHIFLKTLLASVGLSAGFLFGVQFYELIAIVIILVVIDAFTGVWGARESGECVSSRKFIRSVPKLLRYLVFIVAGHLLQMAIPVNLYIENVVIVFLATTEFISIAENLAKAGMPIPKNLLTRIEKLRGEQ